MKKTFFLFIFFTLFSMNFITQAEENNQGNYYITFIFREGKVVSERVKDPLYGEQEYNINIELENPVLYREGKWYVPLEFFIKYFGGRFVTVNENEFLIIFQEGTYYEEKIYGEILGRNVILNFFDKKATGFVYLNINTKNTEIYISEDIFLFFEINPQRKERQIAITLDLEF